MRRQLPLLFLFWLPHFCQDGCFGKLLNRHELCNATSMRHVHSDDGFPSRVLAGGGVETLQLIMIPESLGPVHTDGIVLQDTLRFESPDYGFVQGKLVADSPRPVAGITEYAAPRFIMEGAGR